MGMSKKEAVEVAAVVTGIMLAVPIVLWALCLLPEAFAVVCCIAFMASGVFVVAYSIGRIL